VKEFRKSVDVWQSYDTNALVYFVVSPCVFIYVVLSLTTCS